jgi:WD40 repeat protein
MCHMWDGLTSHAKANFKRQGIIRNIQCVGFSPSGNRLGIVDESDDHNIAVYDTKTYTLVCKTKGDRGSVRDMAFKDDDVLVTTGPGHFKQWTIGTAGNFE